jgi:hypothetical protein
MNGKFILGILKRLILGNKELMLTLLFWILEEYAKSTDNTLDDTSIKIIKGHLLPDGGD